jgi:hypothetical protein
MRPAITEAVHLAMVGTLGIPMSPIPSLSEAKTTWLE